MRLYGRDGSIMGFLRLSYNGVRSPIVHLSSVVGPWVLTTTVLIKLFSAPLSMSAFIVV